VKCVCRSIAPTPNYQSFPQGKVLSSMHMKTTGVPSALSLQTIVGTREQILILVYTLNRACFSKNISLESSKLKRFVKQDPNINFDIY
jgi:hypothetical protein